MGYCIRRATVKDLDELVRLIKLLGDYHHGFDADYRPGREMTEERKFLAQSFRKRNRRFYVAVSESKIIGFCSGEVLKKSFIFRTRQVGHIQQTFIEPRFRHAGIGREFISLFITWFKSRGLTSVEITVDTRNKLGVAAWKRLGFKEYQLRLKKRIG